jgi:hypothetical protein
MPAPAGVLFLETARPPFVFCFLLMDNPPLPPHPLPFFFMLASQKSYIKNKKCC